jgi:hypothetical protein
LKFRRLIESGKRTLWRPGQSGNPKGSPPDGVMTLTRERRERKRQWQEFRELCRRMDNGYLKGAVTQFGAGPPAFALTHARGSPHPAVPSFVPSGPLYPFSLH